MLELITDRTQSNVDRLKVLSQKSWSNMTVSEQAEWSGNPLTAAKCGYNLPINLVAHGPYESTTATLSYKRDSIVATSLVEGSQIYAVSIIGDATNFEGKTVTLSVDEIHTLGGGTPLLSLNWYDSDGWESAGDVLETTEGKTITLTENAQNRSKLALFVYVSCGTEVKIGAVTKYSGIMLEFGEVEHEYVPYTAIIPTAATKGAYNFSDLNRVELAVSELAEHLGLALQTKTNWQYSDLPNTADMERYLANIKAVRDRLELSEEDYSLPDNMYRLNYESANTIEKVLVEAYKYIGYPYRSGELYSGEV